MVRREGRTDQCCNDVHHYRCQRFRQERKFAGIHATFPSINWRDFVDVGVPSPCPREWRPRTTERWLIPRSRATCETELPGWHASATSCSFSLLLQRAVDAQAPL